jgi:hypothetical protein
MGLASQHPVPQVVLSTRKAFLYLVNTIPHPQFRTFATKGVKYYHIKKCIKPKTGKQKYNATDILICPMEVLSWIYPFILILTYLLRGTTALAGTSHH